jgi:hypothetical protein
MNKTIIEANKTLIGKIINLSQCRKRSDGELYFYATINEHDCFEETVRFFVSSNVEKHQIAIPHVGYSGCVFPLYNEETLASDRPKIVFSYGREISIEIMTDERFDEKYDCEIFYKSSFEHESAQEKNIATILLDRMHENAYRAISKDDGKIYYCANFHLGNETGFPILTILIDQDEAVIPFPSDLDLKYERVILVDEVNGSHSFIEEDELEEKFFILPPNKDKSF